MLGCDKSMWVKLIILCVQFSVLLTANNAVKSQDLFSTYASSRMVRSLDVASQSVHVLLDRNVTTSPREDVANKSGSCLYIYF